MQPWQVESMVHFEVQVVSQLQAVTHFMYVSHLPPA